MPTPEALALLRKAQQEMYLVQERHRAFIETPDRGFSTGERIQMAMLMNELIDAINDYWRAFEEAGEFLQPEVPIMQHERRSLSDRRQALLRQNDRVPLQVPICIRYDNLDARFEEITETINVSRRGVYFKSTLPYSTGATVFVTLNYSPTNPGSNIEKLGTIVRVETPATSSDSKGIAMQLS
jgi:hypothetical protein